MPSDQLSKMVRQRSWSEVGQQLVRIWSEVGQQLVSNWSDVGQMLVKIGLGWSNVLFAKCFFIWPIAGQFLTIFRPAFGQHLTHVWPTFDQVCCLTRLWANFNVWCFQTNFRRWSDSGVGQQMASSWSDVGQKLTRSWSEIGQELVRSWPEVGQEMVSSWSEVGLGRSNILFVKWRILFWLIRDHILTYFWLPSNLFSTNSRPILDYIC